MDTLLIEAKVRDTKASPMYLRSVNQIPAVFYGKKQDSVPLTLEYQAFRKVFQKAGRSKIIELIIDGKKKPALIHEVQLNPLSDRVSHVDFKFVNMDEEITARIPLITVGIAPAVKDLGGILTTVKQEVEVRCLPKDLPGSIEIDVSVMDSLHSSIHVKDLKVGAGVKFMTPMEDVVVTISQAKEEVEAAPVAAAVPAAGEAAAPAAGAAPEAKKE